MNPALPVSCAQLKQQGNTMDMEYKLYLNGDSALPYMAYCYNMMNTPTEYLTLNAGGQSNASRFVAVVPVSTDYQRVRFDPKTQLDPCSLNGKILRPASITGALFPGTVLTDLSPSAPAGPSSP